MSVEIAQATPDRMTEVMDVIAAAMQTDPGWGVCYPDPAVKRVAMRQLTRTSFRQAIPAGATILAAMDGSRVVGGAVLMPPGTMPMTFTAWMRGVAASAGFSVRHPLAAVTMIRMVDGIEKPFPKDPVSYVEWVGVAPDQQGRGVGSTLVRGLIDAARPYGKDMYLETQNEVNVPFYERAGFVLTRGPEVIYRNGPIGFYMRRPAD